jgi:chromosome segregation ATPase
MVLATTLRLDCIGRLQDLARQSDNWAGAELQASPDVSEVGRQQERAEALAEADRLRQLLAERDAEREQVYDEWVRTETALQHAEVARSDLEAIAADLRDQLNGVAAESAHAQEVQKELAIAEKELQQRATELSASEDRQLCLIRKSRNLGQAAGLRVTE